MVVKRHMARFVELLAAIGMISSPHCSAQVRAVRAEAIEVRLFLQTHRHLLGASD